MPRPLLLALALVLAGPACSQTPEPKTSDLEAPAAEPPEERPGLYACDGCEEAIERAPADLDWRLALAPEGEPGDRLVVTGRVLGPDGETPAAGVVLYLHQTNAAGLYRSRRSTGRGGPTDGMIEGWLETDATGRFEVATVRPGPYPDGGMPAHIHLYVGEPGRRAYYLDDVVFEGDPFVNGAYRAAQEFRGGGGIVRLAGGPEEGWRAHRDIVLER